MEWNLCMGSSPRSSQGILILLSSGESGARGAALSVCVLCAGFMLLCFWALQICVGLSPSQTFSRSLL